MKEIKNKILIYLTENGLNLSFALISALFAVFCLSFTGFIINFPLLKFYPILGLAAGAFLLYKLNKENFKINFALYAVIIIFSTLFALLFYDNTWDGRVYHQSAIILLKTGWNPIYDTISGTYSNPIITSRFIWIENYPKLSEILAANVFNLIGKIEAGKSINYIFALSSFLLAFQAFKNIKSKTAVLLFAAAVCLNPVSICQIATFYNDFLVYYLFLNLILIEMIRQNSPGKKLNIFTTINLVMLANVKLGGLFLVILFFIITIPYRLISKESLKETGLIALITCVLILISGINPYFTNILNGRNPLYPHLGKDKISMLSVQTPKFLKNKPAPVKLLYSTFGAISPRPEAPKFKLPFKGVNFCIPDMQIGGFGFFWAATLLLGLLLLVFAKNRPPVFWYVSTLILITVFLNPYSWWARYAPQFWAFPVFAAAFCYEEKKFKPACALILVLIFLNGAIIEFQNVKSRFGYYLRLKGELKPEMTIYIDESRTEESYFEKLIEKKISFKIVSKDYFEKNKQNFTLSKSSLGSIYIEK